jgi:hypothetical protein
MTENTMIDFHHAILSDNAIEVKRILQEKGIQKKPIKRDNLSPPSQSPTDTELKKK